ncbi:hypothetical protein JCM19231_2247 [Vibrio ishigakensis]|uniref:Uncharacterized protein n=1 Tax=Vibrio ishigakensis TaxID=1481914 RepID=A0A0B8NTB4_9VIBR|nr:hypothetical protein [Vibrio ishigakensis]GAM54358.1 hypothetical protein JCM19231_2247 [Vibrio ishigakensis]
MKASILALTISTALSANAFAQSTKVDVQAANAETHELIDRQMRDIDASVQAQLKTTSSDTQAIDPASASNIVNKQESNSTWAAVGTASAALVAGMLSTSSSSNENPDDVIPSLPTAGNPDNELPGIDDDNSVPDNSQTVFTVYNGMIAIDDKLVGHINDAGQITDANGNTVGQIRYPENAEGDIVIVLDNGDILKVIEAGNGWVIDIDDSIIDGDMDSPDAPKTFGEVLYDETIDAALIVGDNGTIVSINSDGEYTVRIDYDTSIHGNIHDHGDVTRLDNGFEIVTENGTYVVSSIEGRLSIVLTDGGNPELHRSKLQNLQNVDQNKLQQVKAKVQNRLATLKK